MMHALGPSNLAKRFAGAAILPRTRAWLAAVAQQPPVAPGPVAPAPVAPTPVAPTVPTTALTAAGATLLGLAVLVGVGVSLITVEVLERVLRRRPPRPPRNDDPPDDPRYDECFWCTCTSVSSEGSAQQTDSGAPRSIRCTLQCECPDLPPSSAELFFDGRSTCPRVVRIRVCVIRTSRGTFVRVVRHEIVQD
jgi:hypothetical protein